MATRIYTLTGTSPAAPTTGAVLTLAAGDGIVGNVATRLDEWDSLIMVAAIQGATGGTLDLYLQHAYDESGNSWSDYVHFAQLAAGAAQSSKYAAFSKYGGQVTNFPTIGFNLSPALAANTAVGGPFGSMMRVVCVAGAGTTAGAQQTFALYGQRGLTFR